MKKYQYSIFSFIRTNYHQLLTFFHVILIINTQRLSLFLLSMLLLRFYDVMRCWRGIISYSLKLNHIW